ncbi:hypothetical protein KCP70_00815 [Salmonella enterica subsp. enterica]|nr:hypothetical protein KCP70_00815 [Salmonella enterica subsp. enterica]
MKIAHLSLVPLAAGTAGGKFGGKAHYFRDRRRGRAFGVREDRYREAPGWLRNAFADGALSRTRPSNCAAPLAKRHLPPPSAPADTGCSDRGRQLLLGGEP